EATLENHPLLIPVYDIRSIGAGGGSIAWIEEDILKVGPHSAGAEPGPICYGRGGLLPTVTDAAVHLGYIDPVRFLGGDMELDATSASLGIKTKLAEPLGISEIRAASGIFDILLAKTVGAVRQITVERGRDPATATLLGFGGAGPMLAPLVAHELEISSVIIPVAPSGFSAWGMLSADVVDDYALTMIRLLDDIEVTELESMFKTLEEEALASLIAQGVEQDQATLVRQLELRYLGQEHALAISVGRPIDFSSIHDVFSSEHEKRYGHTMDAPIQVLNLRIRGIGTFDRPQLPHISPLADDHTAVVGSRNAFCFMSRELVEFVMYDRNHLGAGTSINGPALIDEGTSVTVIHSNQSLVVDQYGNLLISTGV
ncbi:MAG: methylhydantoinase, partial [Acidiferrobacteraceae bacterium]|nr:methylhydantoinase [Acidiferrobacteraceae bacterium]